MEVKRGVTTGGNFPLENNTKLSFQIFQKRVFWRGNPRCRLGFCTKKIFSPSGEVQQGGVWYVIENYTLNGNPGKWWGCSNFGGPPWIGFNGGTWCAKHGGAGTPTPTPWKTHIESTGWLNPGESGTPPQTPPPPLSHPLGFSIRRPIIRDRGKISKHKQRLDYFCDNHL